jgi:anaerobic nitric oxide reductase transcription regulator
METAPLLLKLSLDLTKNLNASDRLQRLLSAVRNTLNADAAALLLYDGKMISVKASHGLTTKGQQLSWHPDDQPRLSQILAASKPVHFPADCQLIDPFDGYLENDPHALHFVHSCMGLPLRIDEKSLGCLTADALSLEAFKNFDQEFLETLGALTSVALKASLERDELEKQAIRKEEWAKSLQNKLQAEFIGESSATQAFKKELTLVAKSPYQLLLTGETGTGKEVAARLAHKISSVADGPFVAVNCAAIPENLVESELFGHLKGSFTGAINDRPGCFEIADNGTLFLDEIGDLPLPAQAKLLRVLEEGEVQRIGSDRPHKVNVRLIAATNQDLEKEVKNGTFRKDLYHRIAVFPITIPPLSQRLEDIPALTRHFTQSAEKQLHCGPIQISEETIVLLQNSKWPGNVRELRNVIFVGTLRAKNRATTNKILLSPIDFEGIGSNFKEEQPAFVSEKITSLDSSSSNLSLKEQSEEFKKKVIINSLKNNDYNWSLAARQLGMDRSNLFHISKRLGIQKTSKAK